MKKKLIALSLLGALVAMPAFAHDDYMFRKMDTDGDGKITKDEYQAYYDKKFDEIDTNGDGVLSRSEINAYKAKEHQQHAAKNGQHASSNTHPVKGDQMNADVDKTNLNNQ